LARDTVREVVMKWERHDWAYIMVVFWRGEFQNKILKWFCFRRTSKFDFGFRGWREGKLFGKFRFGLWDVFFFLVFHRQMEGIEGLRFLGFARIWILPNSYIIYSPSLIQSSLEPML
jgi:hypothetical protein